MMRRRAIRLSLLGALCLLLGVVTTVGVAWACADPDHVARAHGVDIPFVRAPRDDHTTWITGSEERAFGVRVIDQWRNADVSRTYVRTGWPWRALQTVQHSGLRAGPGWWDWERGVEMPAWLGGRGLYDRRPVLPLWGGLVGDTIFYALILGAVFFVPGPLRRWCRRRGGRCVFCGYDLKGSPGRVCPECGAGRVIARGKADFRPPQGRTWINRGAASPSERSRVRHHRASPAA